MKYKISELSKILDIPVNTLRFYENMGIVTPERNEANGYRLYDSYDFLRLLECKMFKSMGIPLRDFSAMISTNDPNDNMQLFQNHLAELKTEIDHLQMLYNRLSELSADIDAVKLNLNRCWVRHQKPKYALNYMLAGDDWVGEINLNHGAFTKWVDAFPYVYYYTDVSVSHYLKGEPIYNHSFMVDQDIVGKLALPLAHAVPVPARNYISMMVCLQTERYPTEEMLRKMLDFASENHYQVSDTFFFSRVVTGFQEEEYNRYMELHLPIENI